MEIYPIEKINRKYWYDELEFDSKEEIYFNWLLDDIGELHSDIIEEIHYNTTLLNLSEKTVLLRKHIYTPDFIIKWNCARPNPYTIAFSNDLKAKQIKDKFVTNRKGMSYIEIKGGFSIYNNHREFSVNQKWVFAKYGIYIQKIEIPEFFKTFFTPERYLFTDSGKKTRSIK